MTTTLPYWAASLVQQVEVHQHAEARHERDLREIATRERQRATGKREAVAQFVDIAYAFAGTVLQTPHDYPAHVIDYAVGLLHESLDFVRAETAARGI